MQRLSYPTEAVLSKKIARNRLVLSFKDCPRKPLGRRPIVTCVCQFSARRHIRNSLTHARTVIMRNRAESRVKKPSYNSHVPQFCQSLPPWGTYTYDVHTKGTYYCPLHTYTTSAKFSDLLTPSPLATYRNQPMFSLLSALWEPPPTLPVRTSYKYGPLLTK